MAREQHEKIKKRLIEHVRQLAIPRCHVFHEENVNAVISYLERAMQSCGYNVNHHRFQTAGQFATNVECLSSNNNEQDIVIFVTAHHDSFPISPGADDNASAMAVLLEVARVLNASNEKHGIGFLFFDLEELSMDFLQYLLVEAALKVIYENELDERMKDEFITKKNQFLEKNKYQYPTLPMEGSNRWIHERLTSFPNLKAVINLESVGYRDESPKSQQPIPNATSYVPNAGQFLAITYIEEFQWLFSKLFTPPRDLHLKVVPIRAEPEVFTFGMRSDHANFWAIGFPAIMLTDTFEYRNPHYHLRTDNPDTLDYDFMAMQVQWLVKTLPRLVKQLWSA